MMMPAAPLHPLARHYPIHQRRPLQPYRCMSPEFGAILQWRCPKILQIWRKRLSVNWDNPATRLSVKISALP